MSIHSQSSNKHKATYDPILSYEDIERWMWCRYEGDPGWIIDKGKIAKNINAEHIEIRFISDRNNIKIHKRLVNKYLEKKKKLWVDFDHSIVMKLDGDTIVPNA